MEGRILQRAELYYVENGLARHIENWEDYERLCIEKYGRVLKYHERVFKEGKDFPLYGRKIKTWPEKEPEYKIGPERLMFCVGLDVNFAKIRDLGITIIQSYVAPYHIQDYLDKAKRYGLKLCNSVCGIIEHQIKEQGDWNRDDMQAQIDICKDHPAFHSWHIFEEINIASHKISHSIQRQVYDFFKARDPLHPITQTLSGFVKDIDGGKDWDYVNFDALDFITPDLYVYDGTGDCWGMKPLEALELGARQEREYLDSKGITKPVIFTFQCCDEPAVNHDPPMLDTQVPLGHIEEQFAVIKKYGLFTGGLGLWAWNHGYFGPETSPEMYQEVKDLLNKIEES